MDSSETVEKVSVELREEAQKTIVDDVGGDAKLVNADGDIVKLPIPSSDPNDPLNYKSWEKLGIIVCCCWFSIMSLSLIGGLGAILGVFFALYAPQGYSTNQILWLSTFPSLFVGIGNYLILPMALAFGRRPTFLLSAVVLLAATIGSATQNSWEGHLATRIIQGLATGATESLLPLMLTEVTFLHQRSMVFGAYWATQNCVSSALNLAGSYLTADMGWRWYYWVYVIAVAVGLVLTIFLAFETRYRRSAAALAGQVVVTDDFGTTRVLSEAEYQAYLAEMEAEMNLQEPAISEKLTYVQMIKPWSGSVQHPVRTIVRSWLHMLEAFTSPGILYATLLSSITLGCSIAISLTYDAVLESYGWDAADVGLINIGGIIGGFGGMLYAGILGDKFTLWMAKRNGGIHLPEHRLLLLILPGIFGFASLMLYGYTAGGGATWWGPYLAWTIFQIVFTSVLIISTSFAAEAWARNPGPAIVAVVGTKNIISFGAAYGLSPMVTEHGYAWAHGILAGVYGAIFLLGIPVYLLNPKWRQYAARKAAFN